MTGFELPRRKLKEDDYRWGSAHDRKGERFQWVDVGEKWTNRIPRFYTELHRIIHQ
jgi:hypothetical protein